MLIATVPQKNEEQIIAAIKEVGVRAVSIGVVTNKGRNVKRISGKTEVVEEFVAEELWRALKTTPKK
jgi:hydrogenase maturation factor